MNFAETIVSKRKSLGLTQIQLADQIGISRNYLALLEQGKQPVERVSLALFIVLIAKLELGGRIRWNNGDKAVIFNISIDYDPCDLAYAHGECQGAD